MIIFKDVTLRRGQQVLLEKANWTIYSDQRIGIIGANGAGKTSLFQTLLGRLHIDKGDLTIAKNIKFAHVAQETPALERSILDYVLDGDQELRSIEKALDEEEATADGLRLAALHEKLFHIDAYTAPTRAAQLLAGLGFSQEEQMRPVSAFSGGWRMRLNLAQALMSRSDILLLDEPTNHLDLDAVIWLEEWLIKYPGTLLMISHDRDFLDKTVNFIAHLHQQGLKVYTGNYSTFETLRAQALLLQQAVYDKQQRQLAHLTSFVERFRAKASKARQAQSRLKAIERMDLVCAIQTESPFEFSFREPALCPNPLLQLDKAVIAYGDHVILRNLSFTVTPKERIAILGPNGAGKSSLIKLLAGQIEPATGIREASAGLKIGYFAQHQVDHLDLQATPLLHLQRIAPRHSELELRSFLGGFGFLGDHVFKAVGHFSGGEKSRLALALLVWQQPNLLLLDEPTNHLDLEMRQALSLALQEYTGAMLLVSHDRFLVRTTTDQLVLVADGKMEAFEGDLDDYERWLINYRKQQTKAQQTKATVAKAQVIAPKSKPLSAADTQKLEDKCTQLSEKIAQLNTILNDPTLYESQYAAKLKAHLDEKTAAELALQAAEEAWFKACNERE